jgi:hypothetical protein
MYSTIREANEYALAVGEVEFLDCDATGIECLANGAIGVGDLTINVDGITAGEQIKRYDLLQIQDEYCLVTGVNGAVLTVERGFGDTVPAAYLDNQQILVKTQLKVKLISRATREFVNVHRQYLSVGTLWAESNAEIREQCAIQVIYMARYVEEVELTERIGTITLSEYADGVLSIKYPGGRKFAPGVQDALNDILRRMGVSVGGFLRG